MACLTMNGVWYSVPITMIFEIPFKRLFALMVLSVFTRVAPALICGPELEALSGDDLVVLTRTSEGLAHYVLGAFDARANAQSPLEAKVIFTNWKRQATFYVTNLRGDPKVRADVYEVFAKEIARRAALMKQNSGIEMEWDYTRTRLPDGSEVFYGSKGFFYELGPFNRCYGGKFRSAPTAPGWTLPYDEKGRPLADAFKARQLLDPAVAPNLMFDSVPRRPD